MRGHCEPSVPIISNDTPKDQTLRDLQRAVAVREKMGRRNHWTRGSSVCPEWPSTSPKTFRLPSDGEENKTKQNRFTVHFQFKAGSQFISRVGLSKRPSPVDGQRGSTRFLFLFFGALRVVCSPHSGEVRRWGWKNKQNQKSEKVCAPTLPPLC